MMVGNETFCRGRDRHRDIGEYYAALHVILVAESTRDHESRTGMAKARLTLSRVALFVEGFLTLNDDTGITRLRTESTERVSSYLRKWRAL